MKESLIVFDVFGGYFKQKEAGGLKWGGQRGPMLKSALLQAISGPQA
ncbi:hypothetical protein [Uliginosibacterium aquaticum]|uniref:Uncharacterized protein n=1 Tax=Uliginosibacterium aquaticum TaxID=2731212 RepID=A0ABX2IE31_9RHOO|nr:hypothetical protein [Uliginosibacterium aquaticum]NSL54783.1 hypothetical protein [Uliginosibacterium aquaticum]